MGFNDDLEDHYYIDMRPARASMDFVISEGLGNFLDLLNKTGCWIMGGFARYVACDNPAPVGDIDVFSGTEANFVRIKLGLELKDMIEGVLAETDLSITYKLKGIGLPVQIIKAVKNDEVDTTGSTVDELLAKFDFTVCLAYLKPDGTAMVDSSLKPHESKRDLWLANVQAQNPIGVMNRVIKYTDKGYTIDKSQLVKIMEAYANLPIDKRKKYVQAARYYGLV